MAASLHLQHIRQRILNLLNTAGAQRYADLLSNLGITRSQFISASTIMRRRGEIRSEGGRWRALTDTTVSAAALDAATERARIGNIRGLHAAQRAEREAEAALTIGEYRAGTPLAAARYVNKPGYHQPIPDQRGQGASRSRVYPQASAFE